MYTHLFSSYSACLDSQIVDRVAFVYHRCLQRSPKKKTNPPSKINALVLDGREWEAATTTESMPWVGEEMVFLVDGSRTSLGSGSRRRNASCLCSVENPASTIVKSTHGQINRSLRENMSFTDIETEALVVEKPGADFKLTPIILDEVRGNEVLVEMKYSGICHTDIVVQQGELPIPEYPIVLGHEGAGIIRAIGADVKDKSLAVGDQVLLSYTICQQCAPCREGRPTFCYTHGPVNFRAVRLSDGSTPARLRDDEKTTVRSQFFGHSSFARMSVVHDYSVVKCPVPEMLPCYAPLGCGFQTGAGTVLNALQPSQSARVVIFGLGSVGLAALMAAAHLQVKQLIGVDIVDSKLDLARELGATDVVNSANEGSNLAAKLIEITGGGADVAIDCSGATAALQAAVDCIGYGGSAVSVGVPHPGVKIDIETLPFFLGCKTFRSVIEGQSTPSKFIPELIQLHQNGRFPIDKICKVYSIKNVDQALKDMHDGRVIKPIIKWD